MKMYVLVNEYHFRDGRKPITKERVVKADSVMGALSSETYYVYVGTDKLSREVATRQANEVTVAAYEVSDRNELDAPVPYVSLS